MELAKFKYPTHQIAFCTNKDLECIKYIGYWKYKMSKLNDLFFTCSLIEYIARKTMNTKKYIVEKLGTTIIEKIYNNNRCNPSHEGVYW